MSLADLQPNRLYILLFIRHHPPIPNDFHWGLYFHRDSRRGGTKYHIKQQGSGWISAHGPTSGVFKSFLLVGLFGIADVPGGWEDALDQTIRTYDHQLNQPATTCRVWLFRVLALLQNAHVLKCTSLEELEAEAKSWGNAHASDAADNLQPRPFANSSLCGL
ncbi:uncharacterized protein BO66DRAFT_443199 [Aspergillus aculeatinus CBS 121060]|uniref:Uncharacterized protein n=1 Tax=Aspergillus aculeatinus CBS 121060 TaxID=1448322 RepID=A0ACD1GV54_9EURO|nr:hypothetical protein BO66DRAFT_443199 [Aspergillus aculeatinus CBS 121060]RAH65209.1 hypothetical protein BO66DRAFT_443199 [Aspergillus aculeatinus CBS 121060]